MKLISLRLCNFRPFYGETPEIALSGSVSRKITVIHGSNGSGKTTLLNAFTWILFGRFTAAFDVADELVNKRALAEVPIGQPVECWGELMFDHSGKQYRIRRSRQGRQEVDRVKETADQVVLWFAEEDGRWKKLDESKEPEQVINRILPESLYQYFFFDGERIEKIVQANKKAEIAEATKTLLGLLVLDRSVDHLKKVKKIFQEKLKSVGNAEIQQFLHQKESLEQNVEVVERRQTEIEQELIYQGQLKSEISGRLSELAEARQLQLRRDELEQQEKLDEEKLRQAKANLRLNLSTRGYTVLLSQATAQFKQLVDGLRERGELPADIKQQFVKDLLIRQRCICGSELCEGSHAYEQVSAYLSKAGLADVETTVIRMGAQVEGLEVQVPQFWEEVEREQRNISQLTTALSRTEETLDEIREQLRTSPSEDIQNLQARLDEMERQIRRLTLEQGENNQKLKDDRAEIEQLERQIEKYQLVEEKQILAQRRIRATDEAIACLQTMRENYNLLFRSQLENRIQAVFSKISITPYLPRLNEKYELTLEDSTTGRTIPVAASQGEKQILSLSFIGAIVDCVREWSKKQTGMFMGPDSDTFPLVMDSSFGDLDPVHRRQVSRSIPVLANQLVVLVSKTQWRDEVEQEMDQQIGRMYVLSYHSPKPNCETDQINLKGDTYPLVQQSDQFEWTEILEVDGL